MKLLKAAVATLAGVLLSLSGSVIAAENSIKDVQARRDGNHILLKVQMEKPIKALPSNWSIVEPPRVVFDFPEMENQTGQNSQQLTLGDLKSLNLVQTDKLTRLVLNLYRPTKFSTEIADNVLFIRLEAQAIAAGQEAAPSVYQPPPPPRSRDEVAATDYSAVRDISFRRGEDGQAMITVDLTDGSIPIDIRRSVTGLTIDLQGVELPDRLQNRRDVLDFATPVASITTRPAGNHVRMDVAVGVRNRWFHQAHLANNQLIIEVKPIPVDDANKLVQSGQQGQKVSINFFNADAAMVLRTLAEISGKNVMVDQSLTGRMVTANLDNIPYDQALEIIMGQVNAGMRVRSDVVLFGDRAVLAKRELDRAEEAAKSDETAPLVSETFQLNYAKAEEVRNLLLLGDSSGASARMETASGQSAGAANVSTTESNASAGGGNFSGSRTTVSGRAGDKTGRLSGVLSSRGTMNVHAGSNKLFVTDIASVIERVGSLVRQIDIPERQVLIEARIVRADTNFGRALGVRLGYNDLGSTVPGRGVGDRIAGNVYGMVTGGQADAMSLTGQNTGGGGALGTLGGGLNMVNLPVAGNGQFALSIFNSALTRFINLELMAAENEGKSTNISSPRVITGNNMKANISRGQKIPYSTASAQGTNTQFIDATLSLTVTPQIAPNGTVILELDVKNDTVGSVGNPPSINTTALKTKVTVENGGTVVLGGVMTDDSTTEEKKVPWLGDLPVVGNLFKSTNRIQAKGELLIFITPRVIQSGLTQSGG